jgi:hypothetical protein
MAGTSSSSPKKHFPYGVWESTDAARRWKIDVNANNCTWTERNTSGNQFTRSVALRRITAPPNPVWRIERPNDAAALQFLGASSTTVSEVLAQSPSPSFILLELRTSDILGHWNGLRWTLKPDGHLDHVEQPGTTAATKKDYTLTHAGNDGSYFAVSSGQLTFGAEGSEGDANHSRWLHWPGGASGVTLGRGYDMKNRTAAKIKPDLTASGVDATLATSFAGGAGKSGNAAKTFVDTNRDQLGNISPNQQKQLFISVYKWYNDDAIRICKKADVVSMYGTVNFSTLNAKIWTVVVDLHFRGDYGATARTWMQKLVVNNDLPGFKTVMADRTKWIDVLHVPQDRFDRRVAALN